MLPVAFGANGQPPRPPTEASRAVAPARERPARSRSPCFACCGSDRRPGVRAPRPALNDPTARGGRPRRSCRRGSACVARLRPHARRSRPHDRDRPHLRTGTRTRRWGAAGRRHLRPSPRARGRDPACGEDGLLDRGALVSPVERLGDAEREAHLIEPCGEEPFVAALVEGEPGSHGGPGHGPTAATTSSAAGHLRNAAGVHEARDLECPSSAASARRLTSSARPPTSRTWGSFWRPSRSASS